MGSPGVSWTSWCQLGSPGVSWISWCQLGSPGVSWISWCQLGSPGVSWDLLVSAGSPGPSSAGGGRDDFSVADGGQCRGRNRRILLKHDRQPVILPSAPTTFHLATWRTRDVTPTCTPATLYLATQDGTCASTPGHAFLVETELRDRICS